MYQFATFPARRRSRVHTSLGRSRMNLALNEQRIELDAAVVDGYVLVDLDLGGLRSTSIMVKYVPKEDTYDHGSYNIVACNDESPSLAMTAATALPAWRTDPRRASGAVPSVRPGTSQAVRSCPSRPQDWRPCRRRRRRLISPPCSCRWRRPSRDRTSPDRGARAPRSGDEMYRCTLRRL